MMQGWDAIARLRHLVGIFVALALLFAPGVAHFGMADAAAPHHERMMEQTGHCSLPAGGLSDHGKAAGNACCSSICVAIAADAATSLYEASIRSPAPAFALAKLHIGYLGEIATPPPRRG
jgi:hypothetical protein